MHIQIFSNFSFLPNSIKDHRDRVVCHREDQDLTGIDRLCMEVAFLKDLDQGLEVIHKDRLICKGLHAVLLHLKWEVSPECFITVRVFH